MMKKILIVLLSIVFLYSPSMNANGIKNVELFDIQKDTVTNVVPTSPLLQEAAESYLEGINRIFVKVRPIPSTGYMVRIPLERPVNVKNEWINELIDEVIIILTKEDDPYLIIFDDENNPYVFYFKGNTDILVKTFNLTL